MAVAVRPDVYPDSIPKADVSFRSRCGRNAVVKNGGKTARRMWGCCKCKPPSCILLSTSENTLIVSTKTTRVPQNTYPVSTEHCQWTELNWEFSHSTKVNMDFPVAMPTTWAGPSILRHVTCNFVLKDASMTSLLLLSHMIMPYTSFCSSVHALFGTCNHFIKKQVIFYNAVTNLKHNAFTRSTNELPSLIKISAPDVPI